MALTGLYHYITYELSETETHLETIEYPLDLPEGDANYDKRGTTEEIEVPNLNSSSIDYSNTYVVVHNHFHHAIPGQDENGNFQYTRILEANIRVYTSQEARNSNIEDFITTQLVQKAFDTDSPAHDQIYTYLKSLPEFQDMIDA